MWNRTRTRLSAIPLILLGAAWLSNCATFTQGTKERVEIYSDPPEAEVSIDARPVGRTPLSVELSRKKAHTITISRRGYLTYETDLIRRLNPWTWGNCLLPLCSGAACLIDFGSGAIYRLEPSHIDAQLRMPEEFDRPEVFVLLDMLSTRMEKIRRVGKRQRYAVGMAGIASGGLLLALASREADFVPQRACKGLYDCAGGGLMDAIAEQIIRVVIGGSGLALMVGSAISLFVEGPYERLPERFEWMPEGTIQDRYSKLLRGDTDLERLARRSGTGDSRRISALGTFLAGALVAAAGLEGENRAADAAFRMTGAAFAAFGALTLIFPQSPRHHFQAQSAYEEQIGLSP